jgi:hypothetical protein
MCLEKMHSTGRPGIDAAAAAWRNVRLVIAPLYLFGEGWL